MDRAREADGGSGHPVRFGAAVGLLSGLWSGGASLAGERFWIYLAIALLGAPIGFLWVRPFDLSPLDVPYPTPESVLPIMYEFLRDLIPFAFLALIARYFILDSAMRRIDPQYRTTPRNFGVQSLVMLVLIAFTLVSSLGSGLTGTVGAVASFVLLIVSIAAILLSQTLFAALSGPQRDGQGLPIGDALLLSYRMTKGRFLATLVITTAGVLLVAVPLSAAIIPLFLVMVKSSTKWLAAGIPLMVLLFVYLESVRFILMTRWYARITV